ncbi:alpha/beta hydrolase fold domain-containing protein [Mycetocola reblochoni]|uniref:Lipase/esterase n=1 Tax=Mycetocola reblochoni REB411 TaxID=1255698 RepID=A0A1R4IJL9_9MICO|nr:alpha/beta hydrolase fold domain-containing protein [Mycetocola reblochoni]SJN19939.1 Lipase/esterase [Mycetocola reblochoni REB411]
MEAAVLVVAVEYALAPEHRFPVAVEQGDAVLRWVAAEAATLHADPMRIALGGTSAGGGIAAAVALRSRGAVGPAVALQLLEVPALDLTARHIDLWPAVVMGVPLPLVLGEMLAVATGYLGSPLRGARNPLASPLRAPDLAGMPPAVVLTAEYDPLRRQGALYAARLRAAGIDASCVRYAGATHDVPIFGRLVPASRRWHDDVVSALRHLHD